MVLWSKRDREKEKKKKKRSEKMRLLLTPLINSKQAIDELEEGEFGDVMQGIWARERGDWLVSKKRKSLGQKMKLRGSINRGKGNGMDGVDLEK